MWFLFKCIRNIKLELNIVVTLFTLIMIIVFMVQWKNGTLVELSPCLSVYLFFRHRNLTFDALDIDN